MIARVVNKYQNESLDNLVESLDSTAVVSESFKSRILTVIEFVGTIGGREPEVAKDQIASLKEDMSRLLLFSENFIAFINLRLLNGLKLEVSKGPSPIGMKVCKCCSQEKDLGEFSFSRVQRTNKKGELKESIYPGPYCKPCHNKINRENKAKRDKKELSDYHKDYWSKYKRKPKGGSRKGGITKEEKRRYLGGIGEDREQRPLKQTV
jgi:hypothetical protein